MSLPLDSTVGFEAGSRLRPLLAKAGRYGLSTSGPVATSAAHFLASLVFVRNLPAGAFGLFSFVLVIVPFCMSMIGAMAVIPVTRSLQELPDVRAGIVATCLKLNLLLSAAAALCVFGLLLAAGAKPATAILLALFGGVLTARWFARCFAYVQGRLHRAVASDLVYAFVLIAGLGLLSLTRDVSLLTGAALLLTAALAGLVPLGRDFFRAQFAALFAGPVRDYAPIFRDMTRWSLLGVVFTEVTVNAAAYLVTFLAGPGAFAMLALGTLMMRPVSLVQSALPDMERPAMTRAIAARDFRALARTEGDFRAALLAMWCATVALAAALLLWFPQVLLKKGYAEHDVVLVTLLTAAIMLVRSFRVPPSVKLQAAGEFKALAGIGTTCCAVSVIGTFVLLMAFGPIASLGGIIAGELVILYQVWRLAQGWTAAHA